MDLMNLNSAFVNFLSKLLVAETKIFQEKKLSLENSGKI